MPTQHDDPTMDSGDALGEAMRVYLEHRGSGSGESDSQLLERNPDLRELLEPLLAEGKSSTGELRSGVTLGDYRLIEPIGRGGMGEVWEAEQISLRRKVALKLLRAQIFASSHAVERFQREALAGARLKHPCIVSVYAVGEAGGVHFIAQELVESRRTLTHLVRDIRELPVIPATYWRETAQRFMQLSDALQLAHESGVIHRDIKPSNILLASDGSPKIADFGLALVAGESELSRTGDLSGSPYYMSPEQAVAKRIGIDARTDIFSLGATLFEALTLQRPFEGDTVAQVLSKIMFDDPRDPREIRSLCPRDLAVICLKMLEKAPAQRYRSMREVADELQRFLQSQPIRARPPGVFGRTLKWSRRHPVWAASGTIICISLGVVTALLIDDHRARTAAEQSAIAATESARATLVSAEQARVEARTSSRITDFLVDAFMESSPTRALGREISAREVLDRGVTNIRNGLTEPTESGPRARLLDSLGMAYSRLGLRKDAENLLTEAHTLSARTFGARDPRTLDISSELAILYVDSNRFEPAVQLMNEVFEAQVALHGAESRAALDAEANLGSTLTRAGDLEPAEQRLRHAVRGLKQLGAWCAPALYSLSEALRGRGKEAESLATLHETLDANNALLGPDSPETLNALEGLAQHLSSAGKDKEAARLWREIAITRECVQGAKHPEAIRAKARAATFDVATRPETALAEMQWLYATCLQEFGPIDSTTADIAKYLSNMYLNLHRDLEAEELLILVLTNAANQAWISPQVHSSEIVELGIAERNLGRPELALSLLEELVEAQDAEKLTNGVVYDMALRQVIELRDGLGLTEGALDAARRWLAFAPKDHRLRATVERMASEFELDLKDH